MVIEDIIKKLTNDYPNEFRKLIIDYIPHDIKTIVELKKRLGYRYSYIYYRFFYVFHVIIKYIYVEFLDKRDYKTVFLRYLSNINKEQNSLHKQINDILVSNFDYLYKVIAEQKNIYYSVYFNNLIKYFLPLPFDIMIYSPIITFRFGVHDLYKKNDLDYLDKISNVDTMKQMQYVKKKNIDAIQKEVDVHVPLEHFNSNIFDHNKDEILYCIAHKIANNNHKLYIAKILHQSNNNIIIEPQYIREYTGYNMNHYAAGLSFESISNEWTIFNKKDHPTVPLDQVSYISVMKKTSKEDLFNVFPKMSFSKEEYLYLFHYTGLKIDQKLMSFQECPTFYALLPIMYETHDFIYYYKDRSCLLYTINKDIDGILDLTQTVATNNPFYGYDEYKRLKGNKQFISFDNKTVLDYYKKYLHSTFHVNNACLTDNKNINIKQFINIHPYCDIGTRNEYIGRRKLQEILFKTRKYDPSKIWIYNYHFSIYEKYGKNYTENTYINNIYHPQMKSGSVCYVHVSNYDIAILNALNVTGFFSTDYETRVNTGGELLLTMPKDYVTLEKYSANVCNKTDISFLDIDIN